MSTKRLIILANSIKAGGRCVAGRKVHEQKGVVYFGDWIRPVSRTGQGELSLGDIGFNDGSLPKVSDIVDIPVEAPEGSESQPENWYIDPKQYWVKVDDYEESLPSVDVDSPPDLCDRARRAPVDRITPTSLAKLDRGQSLYLIDVSRFRIKLEWNPWKRRHQRRALFRYRGQDYELGLTDPEMDAHCLPFPAVGDDKVIDLDSRDKVLCVSLAPEFKGYHYKIVATVIEPDE